MIALKRESIAKTIIAIRMEASNTTNALAVNSEYEGHETL